MMSQQALLRITDSHLDDLKRHLFPGDGLEASAIVLASCNLLNNQIIFLVQEFILIPHDECARKSDYITWPGKYIENAIEKGEAKHLSLFLIHSHPSGFNDFSIADNESDVKVIPCIYQAYSQFHGSIIMTPEGHLTGRFYDPDLKPQYIDKFIVIGNEIEVITKTPKNNFLPFSSEMTNYFRKFKVGIIGASGTGSIVIESLARLGIGHFVLVDDDIVEHKNLNRILNSTIDDAEKHLLKVNILADAIKKYRSDVVVCPLPSKIENSHTILELASCDVLFSCVDTASARMYVDQVSEFFLVPIFDIGVVISTSSVGNRTSITEACARLDYIQPHKTSLKDRGIYTPSMLNAEYLKNASPATYEQQLKEGYLKNVIEEAPSVITLNMMAASFCVNEFIARTCHFRQESNSNYARTLICLGANEIDYSKETEFTLSPRLNLGKGITIPLLGMPSLGTIT